MKYNGPKIKKSRALGIALTPKSERYLDRKPYPPGQHGRIQQLRRRKMSPYKTQLLEKQKRFGSDRAFVERIARESGRIKPDETVFKFTNGTTRVVAGNPD